MFIVYYTDYVLYTIVFYFIEYTLSCLSIYDRLSLMHSLETVERPRERRIERITQQSLAERLGERALSACVPTCFYMTAHEEGHLPDGISLSDFCSALNWAHAETSSGWVRPDLSNQLRDLYNLPVVSWRLGGNHDDSPETIERMRHAGYLRTQDEIDFFQQQIIGRDIADIVRYCSPVIAGVKAGFGANQTPHAIILSKWSEDGTVEVIDPDDRNSNTTYSAEYVRAFLNPDGGGYSIVLPRISNELASQPTDIRFNILEFPANSSLEDRKYLMSQEIARRISAPEFDQLAGLYGETLPPATNSAARLAALERIAAIYWEFRRGRSRQDAGFTIISPEDQRHIDLNDPHVINIIESAAARFGMSTSSRASRDAYDGLIVPGAASVSPRLRLQYALEQTGPSGHKLQYGWIALLGSDRMLGESERGVVQAYAPNAETEFDLLAAVAESLLNVEPLRDATLKSVGYEHDSDTRAHAYYYKTGDGTPVFVLNAPIPQDDVKANTLHTYQQLRAVAGQRLSEGKNMLISTMALVQPVQHTDAEKFLGLPTGVNLETISYGRDYSMGATNNLSNRPPKELLQEFKAYIDSLVRLNNDLVQNIRG